jgi:crotonobetainyl-CoA:carnitine CoA-transferase CaiB-like acyl-CoA transferase
MIGVANDGLWRKFCAIAGLEDVVDLPRFKTNASRVAHRAETLAIVQDAIATQPVAYWYEKLSQASVPVSPINKLGQMLDHPHTDATGIVVEYDHPVGGPVKSVGNPFMLNDEPRTAGLPPPMHGEHTREILAEFGVSDAEIERLKAANVIECSRNP